jgi:repressor LexA
MADLARELNLSRSTIFEHIEELRKKDLLFGCARKARSLSITSKAQKLLDGLDGPACRPPSPDGGSVSVLGTVAAGAPIEAIEDCRSLSLADHFGCSDSIFALEVTGDSMIEEDIREGDIVICRKTDIADNGQLVIATVDNENATLKRFYKEKSSARLEAANPAYDPIYSSDCRIEAVVVGLIRKL